MRSQPLSLLLLTGFLGSGKTSTLRHWLEKTQVPLQRVAVIINDFGEVNVDATLLARRQLELRSITGGCVCCQSFDDLVTQLSILSDNPKIDLVWIETSGLADPEEVFDHLSGPRLQGRTHIRRMILVLDASDFPCSWRGRAVQEEQIRYADLILLNKIDFLDDKARDRLRLKVGEINPAAEIHLTQRGQVDPAVLDSGRGEPSSCAHRHMHHDHDHASPDDDALPHAAATFFLPFPTPISRGDFERLLTKLPREAFRAKGFVRFAESPDQVYTFQKVRDQSELIVLPLEKPESVSTGLVVIGPHLDLRPLREMANQMLPLAAAS